MREAVRKINALKVSNNRALRWGDIALFKRLKIAVGCVSLYNECKAATEQRRTIDGTSQFDTGTVIGQERPVEVN